MCEQKILSMAVHVCLRNPGIIQGEMSSRSSKREPGLPRRGHSCRYTFGTPLPPVVMSPGEMLREDGERTPMSRALKRAKPRHAP